MTGFVSITWLCLLLSLFSINASVASAYARLPTPRYQARSLKDTVFRQRHDPARRSLAAPYPPLSVSANAKARRGISDHLPSAIARRDFVTDDLLSKAIIKEGETVTTTSGTYGIARYGTAPGLSTYFYFHSFANSRLEAIQFAYPAWQSYIHLIAVDGPGIGRSTEQPDLNQDNWAKRRAADMDEIATHYNVQQYGIICFAQGCPYAMAVRAFSQRVTSVVVVAGQGPPATRNSGDRDLLSRVQGLVAPYTKLGDFKVGKTYLSDLVTGLTCRAQGVTVQVMDLISCVPGARPAVNAAQVERTRTTSPKLHTVFTAEPWRFKEIEASKKESFRGKRQAGNVQYLLLASSPWDFKWKREGLAPVELYYGTRDRTAPLDIGEFLKKNIKSRVDLFREELTHDELAILAWPTVIKGLRPKASYSAEVRPAPAAISAERWS